MKNSKRLKKHKTGAILDHRQPSKEVTPLYVKSIERVYCEKVYYVKVYHYLEGKTLIKSEEIWEEV